MRLIVIIIMSLLCVFVAFGITIINPDPSDYTSKYDVTYQNVTIPYNDLPITVSFGNGECITLQKQNSLTANNQFSINKCVRGLHYESWKTLVDQDEKARDTELSLFIGG